MARPEVRQSSVLVRTENSKHSAEIGMESIAEQSKRLEYVLSMVPSI